MQETGLIKTLLSVAVFVAAASASAEDSVRIREARALATVPGQSVGAAYMTIESASPARLVSASSDAAATVQIHEMSMRDGIMRMRRVEGLDLPAGREVRLAPGGIHLMLTGLKKALRVGETVELSLTVAETGHHARVLRLSVPVVNGLSAAAGHHE